MYQGKRFPRPNIRSTSKQWSSTETDPFQVFEIEHDSCLDFEVTVHRGEGITKGSTFQDFLDTPDPYVVLEIPGSSNNKKQTSHVDNSVNPMWDTTFHFFLHPHKEYTLYVYLRDANYSVDEELGEDDICVNTLQNDVPTDHVFLFPGGSKVYTTLTLRKNPNPDLRFSLALCEEEKCFLRARRKNTFKGMEALLGPKGPQEEKQTPTVAVMGSGGGYRAMISLSGALKVLQKSGILDCVTYTAGLSGSSWYISTLYSHDLFPSVTHDQLQAELRFSMSQDWKWHLRRTPHYAWDVLAKYRRGQPVSFTDFFGHILCDALLQGKKEKKLSDLRKVVCHADVPFPLFTCLHAKSSVTCKTFSEWVEFSPYEIGIAKYGTFMKTEHFGSKFIIGKVIKEYPEFPLHYLQGVWGSAFTILFKRLVLEAGRKDRGQILREVHEENMREAEAAWSDFDETSRDSDEEDTSDVDRETEEKLLENFGDHKKNGSLNEASSSPSCAPSSVTKTREEVINEGSCKGVEVTQKLGAMTLTRQESERTSPLPPPRRKRHKLARGEEVDELDCSGKRDQPKMERRTSQDIKEEQAGLLGGFWKSMGTNFLNSRTGRAGMIHNPFRGLSLRKSFPLSPIEAFKKENGEECSSPGDDIGEACRYEPLDNNAKTLYVVDSGLSFNSPYPLLLRPQRAVDLYISFEFSKRPKDDDPPFKELLLAEKWAQQNKVPFPPIKEMIAQYVNKPVQECYIFEHPTDFSCPVIIHFCLVNNKFRKYKAPGVLRTTKEEKDFADFSLFDDPDTPYESTNFVYEGRHFDRLAQLSEFNTSLHVDTIKEVLAKCCKRKQKQTKAQQHWTGAKVLVTAMSAPFTRGKSKDKTEEESTTEAQAPPTESDEPRRGEMRLRLSEENRKKLMEYINSQ